MSWSFYFHGKAAAIRNAVEKENQQFSWDEEKVVYEAAKKAVLVTLAANDDNLYLFVGAQGHGAPESQHGKKCCSFAIYCQTTPMLLMNAPLGVRL